MLPFKSLLTNIPPVTKALTTATLAVSAFAFLVRYRASITYPDDPPTTLPVVAVVPAYALWTPWTFATATLYEPIVFVLAVHSIATLLCGKYMERAWGGREFLKFVAIVSVTSNMLASLLATLAFYATSNEDYLYQIQFSGMGAIISAYLVAFKQLVPEHLVSFFQGIVAIRVKIPFISMTSDARTIHVLLNENISAIPLPLPYRLPTATSPPSLHAGPLCARPSRLVRLVVQDGIRGDRSETFSMASFFPEFLQPIIKVVSNITFHVLVFLRCCRPIPKQNGAFDIENHTANRVPGPLPGSARAEAERRRALALKALDMRLSKHAFPMQPTLPSRVNPPVTVPPTASTSAEITEEKPQPQPQSQVQLQPTNTVLFDTTDDPVTATVFDGNAEIVTIEIKERVEGKRD
ncbi:eukaryotic integral membrane protein-domain-containing protein [Jimgerdemannia flammicorona]|uniref:Eukaryotic integral membrane protein-domain-containing protein n=1 Tax=Jimgerdemannia flammicorona TaxID=994334 RepID=A0A432ZZ92_9FUNG|nr:eukaryotic integral membrane protein-domain-containing protein [Jimgerdemannia flammicorona]